MAHPPDVSRTPQGRADSLLDGRLWLILAVALLGVYAVALGFSLSLPAAVDPIEESIAQIAYLSVHGQPVYTGILDAGRYSLLYGPLCYLPYGAALLVLGPSIESLKFALGIFNAATFFVLWFAFRRLLSRAGTLAALAFIAAAFMLRQMTMFLIRGDVELALAVAIGLLATSTRRPWLALGVFSAAFAFGIDIKITAVFYFLVPFYFFCRRQPRGYAVAAAPLGGAIALLPFALHNISLVNYVRWLAKAAHHPLSARLFVINLSAAAVLLAPLALFFLQWRARDRAAAIANLRTHPILLSLFAFSIAGSAITGSKVGAGRSHLAPTVIVAAYLAALVWRQIAASAQASPPESSMLARWRKAPAALLGLLLAVATLAQAHNLWSICILRRTYVGSVKADIASIQRDHPHDSIELGYGESPNALMPVDSASFFRSQLVFAGNPVSVDAGALFDMGLSELPLPDATVQELRACTTSLWLIPRAQQPFRITNIYLPDAPNRFTEPHLFSPAYLQAFHRTYSKVGHSQYFDLWQCSRR